MDEARVVVRKFDREADQACVFATWRNSAYYGCARKTPEAKEFFKKWTIKIREILKSAHVRVACLEDDPQTIIGYAVATGTHLEWIYVKVEYRNKGIGAMLMPKNIETVTNHLTKIGAVIAQKKQFITQGEWNGEGKSKEGNA